MVKETWERHRQLISAGYGQGFGNHYKPYLWIRRKNTSRVSYQIVTTMPGFQRECHYMAEQEYRLALAVYWLGVDDIREQFPIWPMGHPHPLIGLPGTEQLYIPQLPGLIDIAQDANIDHGYFVGTDVPYIATIDLMVTRRVEPQSGPALHGLSIKPLTQIHDDSRQRMRERLELERRYHEIAGIPYRIIYSELIPGALAVNLSFLAPSASLPKSDDTARHVDAIADAINAMGFQVPFNVLVPEYGKRLGLNRQQSFAVARYCLWHPYTDVDLTQPFVASYPLKPGGNRVRAVLNEAVFGQGAC